MKLFGFLRRKKEYKGELRKEEYKEEGPKPSVKEIKETKNERKRCIAMTRNGTQCKRYALEGSDYCRIHQPK